MKGLRDYQQRTVDMLMTRPTFRVHYYNSATNNQAHTDILAQPGENTEELKRRFQAAFPSCRVTKIKVVRS